MKRILIVLACLPLFSTAQLKEDFWQPDTSRHIPENAKVIYINNSDFKSACNAILDQGFTIDKKDNELQFAETIHPGLNEALPEWKPIITLRIKDGRTILRAKIFSSVYKDYIEAFNRSNKNGKPQKNAYVYAFMMCYKIAKSLGNEITFSK